MNGELDFTKVKARILTAIDAAIAKETKAAAADIRQSVSTQGDAKHHSAPGEPPFRQSGDLETGISATDVEGHAARVVSTDPVGIYMEFGTEKMAPRPFMRPEMQALEGSLLKKIAADVKAELGMR